MMRFESCFERFFAHCDPLRRGSIDDPHLLHKLTLDLAFKLALRPSDTQMEALAALQRAHDKVACNKLDYKVWFISTFVWESEAPSSAIPDYLVQNNSTMVGQLEQPSPEPKAPPAVLESRDRPCVVLLEPEHGVCASQFGVEGVRVGERFGREGVVVEHQRLSLEQRGSVPRDLRSG